MVIASVLWVLSTGAAAQGQAGTLIVTVTDAITHQPITDAEVRIIGSSPYTLRTNDDGVSRVTGIPAQIISLEVRKPHYLSPEPRQVGIDEGQRVRISVELSPVLTKIGEVRARSTVAVSSTTIDAASPQRELSASLLGALSKLSGISADPASFGQGFENGVSINGADPSSTTYAVAGIQQGNNTNINLAQDLFTGATVSFSPGLGYLGGTIDYQTLHPTLGWREKAGFSASSFDGFFVNASATGSYKKLGFAGAHVERGVASFLDESKYEDQSGLNYVHHGSVRRVADMATLRYALGQRAVIEATGISAHQAAQVICDSFLTALPCGAGPGDFSSGRYTSGSVSASGFIGNLQTSIYLAQNTTVNTTDERARLLALRPAPYDLTSGFTNRTATATVFIERGSHQLKGEARIFRTAGFYDQRVQSGRSTGTLDYTTSALSISDRVALGRRLAVIGRSEVNNGNLTGRGATGSVAFNWTLRDDTTIELLNAFGTVQPGVPALRALADPSTALFNCGNETTLVGGPSDPLSSQRQKSLSVALRRRPEHGAHYQLLAGTQRIEGLQRDLLMPLNAAEVATPGGLPAYQTALAGYWSAPRVCGSELFDAARVYVQRYVAHLRQQSSFVNASARLPLGRRLIAIPALAYNHISFSDLDSRFDAKGSLYHNGRQLPLVPRQTAGLTIDYIDRRYSEWLLNAQYIGNGNRNNLPAYVMLNAGVVMPVNRGRLSVVVSNALNSYATRFVQSRGYNPIPVVGGGSVAFPSTPLPPLQWSILFEPRLGRNH